MASRIFWASIGLVRQAEAKAVLELALITKLKITAGSSEYLSTACIISMRYTGFCNRCGDRIWSLAVLLVGLR